MGTSPSYISANSFTRLLNRKNTESKNTELEQQLSHDMLLQSYLTEEDAEVSRLTDVFEQSDERNRKRIEAITEIKQKLSKVQRPNNQRQDELKKLRREIQTLTDKRSRLLKNQTPTKINQLRRLLNNDPNINTNADTNTIVSNRTFPLLTNAQG